MTFFIAIGLGVALLVLAAGWLSRRRMTALRIAFAAIAASFLLPILWFVGLLALDSQCRETTISERFPPGGVAIRIAREQCKGSDRIPHLVWVRHPEAWFWKLAAEFDPPFMPLEVEQMGSMLTITYRNAAGGTARDDIRLQGDRPQRVGGFWSESRILGRRF
jgi:hypothetical protein